MMAAASAADGRDAILFAPSLPPGEGGTPTADDERPARDSAENIAAAAAGLSRLLAARLTEARKAAADPNDRAACADAVCCAETIRDLLGGSGP